VNMAPRRLAAIGLAIVLIVGVSIGIVTSIKVGGSSGSPAPEVVTLNGLIGSEKLPFFQDQRVIDALKAGGFIVNVTTAGSRQIAQADLSKYDFAFPAGIPAGAKIKNDHAGSATYQPFYTPMAIASWKPIVNLLIGAGVAQQRVGYVGLDVDAFLKLAEKGTRWSDLSGNTQYQVNKSVLITSTDPRTSNSAAMYLSLLSYAANNDNIVQSDADVATVMPLVSPLFLKQGFVQSSTEEPFDDYLVQGMGNSPMVMIYESQFISRAAAKDGSITSNMVLMYPEPTIFSKHTFVALNDNARRLGDFLTNDPGMRKLATQFGFRTADNAGFQKFLSDNGASAPDSLVNVIDPPTYETLEKMITQLSQLYGTS
jgi:hypothetical protein